MTRYTGFKVPLLHLRNSTLVKALYDAGVRIPVTPEQASGLSVISDLLVVSKEASSTIEVKEVYDNIDGLLEELEKVDSAEAASAKADTAEAPNCAIEAVLGLDAEASTLQEPPPKIKKKRRTKKEMQLVRARAAGLIVDEPPPEPEEELPEDLEAAAEARAAAKQAADAEALKQLMNKFIKLTDLLPPLPKKGTFEVDSIKDSPYFFS